MRKEKVVARSANEGTEIDPKILSYYDSIIERIVAQYDLLPFFPAEKQEEFLVFVDHNLPMDAQLCCWLTFYYFEVFSQGLIPGHQFREYLSSSEFRTFLATLPIPPDSPVNPIHKARRLILEEFGQGFGADGGLERVFRQFCKVYMERHELFSMEMLKVGRRLLLQYIRAHPCYRDVRALMGGLLMYLALLERGQIRLLSRYPRKVVLPKDEFAQLLGVDPRRLVTYFKQFLELELERLRQDREARSKAYAEDLRARQERGEILEFYLYDWSEPHFYKRDAFIHFRQLFRIRGQTVWDRASRQSLFGFGYVLETDISSDLIYEETEDPALLYALRYVHMRVPDFLALFAKEWQAFQTLQEQGWVLVKGGVYSRGEVLNRYGDFLANPTMDQVALMDPASCQVHLLTIQGTFDNFIVGIAQGVWYLLQCRDVDPDTVYAHDQPVFQYLRALLQRHRHTIDGGLLNMVWFITHNFQTPLRDAEYLLMRYWNNHFKALEYWREEPRGGLSDYHVPRERYSYQCLETGEIVRQESCPVDVDDFWVGTTIAGKELDQYRDYKVEQDSPIVSSRRRKRGKRNP